MVSFFFISTNFIIQGAFTKHLCTRHDAGQLGGESRNFPSNGNKEKRSKVVRVSVLCTKKMQRL